jgi:hypothetical protein
MARISFTIVTNSTKGMKNMRKKMEILIIAALGFTGAVSAQETGAAKPLPALRDSLRNARGDSTAPTVADLEGNRKAFLAGAPVVAQAEADSIAQEKQRKNLSGRIMTISLGPSFGDTRLKAQGTVFNEMVFSGTGFNFDFDFAYVFNNLAFDLLITFNGISSPDLKVDGEKAPASSSATVGYSRGAIGMVYHIMPYDFFMGGSFGFAAFNLETEESKAESETGPSFRLEAGKNWWFADCLGLGFKGGLVTLDADDKEVETMPSYSGELSAANFFILVNLSLKY